MADVPRVTPDELRSRMQQNGKVVVVDVRRGSYDESDRKIAGAIRIDPEAYETEAERLPRGANVVTYCT